MAIKLVKLFVEKSKDGTFVLTGYTRFGGYSAYSEHVQDSDTLWETLRLLTWHNPKIKIVYTDE
jgi:hypothetical protein